MGALLIFVDGFGLGEDDPAKNPVARARLKRLRIFRDRPAPDPTGILISADACMGVPGLPQSATGQTSILAGVNAPAAVGRHINGYCTKSLRALLDGRSLFSRVLAAGGKATFANAYTPRFLERPPRFLSVSTVATLRAGLRLRTLDDLARGEAVFHDYTNRLLPEHGYDVPTLTPREAGGLLARLAHGHSLTMYEHFLTDLAGHDQDMARGVELLENLEDFVDGLLSTIDRDVNLVVLASDHGNLEDLTTRRHTSNPVPAVFGGLMPPRRQARFAVSRTSLPLSCDTWVCYNADMDEGTFQVPKISMGCALMRGASSLATVFLPLGLVCLLALPGAATATQVNVIRVESVISPSSADYIVSAIQQADKEKVAALVIELDTPGGLDSSMRVIIKEMLAARTPIVVYVSPSGARAASAGAFITMAANIAAMAPGTNIGAASPVAIGGQMDKTMERKVTNDAAAYMRTIAEKRGRPIDLAEEWVRKATARTETEALKAKLIDVVSPKLDDLLSAIDGRVVTTAAGKVKIETKSAVVQRDEMNLREKVLKIITDPTIAYLLLILGLAGLYFEFSTPGAILPGVLGGIALILALYAFQQLPINYAGVLLILLAIVMFVAEIKVVSHGVLTIGGIAAMVLGSLMLIDAPAPYMRISIWAILGTAASTALFFLFVVGAGVKALRRKATTGMEALIGSIGVVRTRLAPRGQVFLCGELWNAESEGEVETGASVRVTGMDGLTLRVVQVQRAAAVSEPVAPGRSG